MALALKKAGFDGECRMVYDAYKRRLFVGYKKSQYPRDSEQCLCPTHQVAVAYLMEVHNLYICPKYCCFCGSKPKDRPYFKWEARILKLPSSNIIYPHPLDMCEHYETYEEATEAALKYALENIITREDRK